MLSQSVLPSSLRHHSPSSSATPPPQCVLLLLLCFQSLWMGPTSQQSLSLEAFWFLLSLRVPHPFSHQILTRILSVFHVSSSLTFTAHSSPLNSRLCHFLPRLWPHACHVPVYDVYYQQRNLCTFEIRSCHFLYSSSPKNPLMVF